MKTVVGIFGTRAAADRAARDLVIVGLPPGSIRQLTPGSSEREVHSAIPIAETEQSGMGKAVGGVVGFVVGVTAAFGVPAVLQGAIGSVDQTSLIIAAIGGAIGAVIGLLAGGALEARLSTGLPKDEIYFYEEALRRGRSVVFFFASNSKQEKIARRLLDRAGADSLDAGDKTWRVGLAPRAGPSFRPGQARELKSG